MEAFCALRRGAHEQIHGRHDPGLLQGPGSAWDPWMNQTSNKNGLGDLTSKHGFLSIGVPSKILSSTYITRIIGNIVKDRRGQAG